MRPREQPRSRPACCRSPASTDAGPHSREHALVAALLTHGGADDQTDLPRLVEQILRPPFDRVGVMDLETFFPSRDRQELALRFNSVLATPGFDVWMAGEPPDLASMLFTPEGRPRIAIVSVSHLDDAQRMMAVSLVLNAALEWTRRQGGSSSLRALLYMDEVFGYLPPVANPPSKLPLLTLLKQARAAGVGVMLATQNPVDLDYKALSNTGTWFLGKLQTERDKARVLDGLEGLSSSWTREQLDQTLSGLRSRVFLMHNVHEKEPVTFETRWALSYLRGPLTRDELRKAIGAPGGIAAAAAPAAAARGWRRLPRLQRQAGPADRHQRVLPAVADRDLLRAGAVRQRTRSVHGHEARHRRHVRRACGDADHRRSGRGGLGRGVGDRRRAGRAREGARPALPPLRRAARRRAESQELRGVVRRFRAVDRPGETAAPVLGACLQIELEAR